MNSSSEFKNFKELLLEYLLPLLAVSVVFIIALDLAASRLILSKDVEPGSAKMYRFMNMPSSFSVPILGSSRGRCSFIPAILGPKYFNFSMDGAGVLIHLYLAEEAAKRHQYPYIIINLDPTFAPNVGDEDNYLPILAFTSFSDYVKKFVPAFKFAGWKEVTGLRYAFYSDKLIKSYIQYYNPITSETKGGYTHYLNQELVDTSSFTLYYEKHNNDPNSNDSLVKLLSDLPSRYPDQKFVFVSAPIYRSKLESSVKIDDFCKIMQQFKGSNVYTVNFIHNNYQQNLFHDPTHLNYNGATRMSRELVDSLKQYGLQ